MVQKKILLIGSPSTDDGEQQAVDKMADFVHEALSDVRGEVTVSVCHADEFGFVVSNDAATIYDLHNDTELTSYDMVFFRGKFKPVINDVALVSSYLQGHGIPIVNSVFASRISIGKIPQMFQIRNLKLPIPKTVSAAARNLPRLINDHLSYPMVVKDVQGAHGNDNYLVRSEAQLHEILDANPGMRFMAQEFIPNDCDYRILVIGPTELIIKRQAAGDTHLNNTSQGGNATVIDPAEFPAEIIAESRRFAESRNYEIAGVDVIFNLDTGEHYYLEINSQPQLASGAFVELKSALLGAYFKQLLELPNRAD